jgi:hypothetical protein
LSLPFRPFSFLALFALWAGVACAEAPATSPRIESVTETGYRVVVPIPEPNVTTGEIFGENLAEISLPGGAFDSPAGVPQLPSITLLLRVPWGVNPRVSASQGVERSLGALKPVPLPHLVSDRAGWSALGAAEVASFLDRPEYRSAGRGASQPPLLRVVRSAAGGECLLQVTLRPVRWDPRSGQAVALDRVTLDVSWERPVHPESRVAETGAVASLGGEAGPNGEVGPRYLLRASPIHTARAGGSAAAYAGPLRIQPSRPWVRLGVLRPGLYAVGPADLASAGISLSGIDPATFRVFRATPGDLPESLDVDLGPDSLRECAIVVTGEGDAVFDPGDRIYIYATGATGFGHDLALGGSPDYQEAQRSDEEALWLTWGAGPVLSPAKRMALRDAAPVSPAASVTSVQHRVHYEENRIRDFNLFDSSRRWERWFYRLITQGSRVAFPLTLPGADPGGQGSIVLRMWGKGISVGNTVDDHYTNLFWDGALVASGSWNFTAPQDLLASGFTVRASDTLEVQVPRVIDVNDAKRFDQSDLAWFEVTYPRRLRAINDTLQFAADSTVLGTVHYVVDGITDTTAVWFLDRTDPENPVRYVNGAFSGVSAPFGLTLEDSVASGSPRRYALVSTVRAPRPASIARYAPALSPHAVDDLLEPANGADYLIVAHPSLVAMAESLATFRSSRLSGLVAPRVAIATTDRIAAQFGGGYLDPTAIRNLLAYARLHWSPAAPTYVCLFGDASLDPKNYQGFGTLDLVPTYANYYDVGLLAQFISDDFYGFLDGPGDQILDLAIGRLPAKSALEASTLARAKVQAFETTAEFDPWRARALLCADDSWKREERDDLGNEHVMEMERKDSRHLPYPVERSKVYLNDYAFADTTHQSKPAARDDFIARINQGNWLVDYIGHGSDIVIADEQVFRASDAGRLTNATRPGIFGFFSCTVGKFDVLGQEGLGELLLKTPTGGAAAAIAATERGFGFESTQLNDEFVDQLFPIAPRVDSTVTVGLAYARAKNAHVNSVVRKYVLLGDPALAPPLPRGRGVWEKSPLDSVLRGDLAIIRGHALAPDSTPDTFSAGTALLQVQGKPFRRVQIGLNSIHQLVPFPYEVPGPILFRGSVALDRGAFTARFVVPLDSRIAGGNGQLRALLSQAGGRGVGLAVDSIRVAQGIGSRTDLLPPVITLRYPAGSDSSVQPGDLLTVVIEDSSGIDLMRLDNAHTIFVITDDRGTPAELTAGFAYDPGSYTRGTVSYAVPQLSEGLHTLEIHASDTFGNIGVRTFVLDVHAPAKPGDPMRLSQVFNYPNPFEGTTYVHARLNQDGRLRVQVLTVSGRRVRELSSDGRAGENYLPWDGKDSEGENVAIGVYLLRVTAESNEGKRATAIGRALKTR